MVVRWLGGMQSLLLEAEVVCVSSAAVGEVRGWSDEVKAGWRGLSWGQAVAISASTSPMHTHTAMGARPDAPRQSED